MRRAHVRLAALNIVIVNQKMHTEAAYAALFRDLAKSESAIKARGEQYLEMDRYILQSNDGARLTGTLHRFTAIEAMNWFNTAHHRRATPNERKQIRIPPNIAANYREIPFAVDLKSHTFVFLTKGTRAIVSPTQVGTFMERLCSTPSIHAKYGEISVTIEQDDEELERILKADSIRMLKVTLRRPNESFRKFDKQIFERLANLRAKSMIEEYQAEAKEGIKPDQDLIDKAIAATSNGNVDAKVVVDGVVANLSTKDHPLQVQESYDSLKETVTVAFERGVRAMLSRIKGKKRIGRT